MPLPTVQSKAGDSYAVDSPQGRTILAAKNRAAASAAESAAGSNSFTDNSSTAAAGFVLVDKHLEGIKQSLTGISTNVT